MPRGLFIAGTGTGVGKTYVAARIAQSLIRQGHRVGIYKPVASGCGVSESEGPDDARRLWEAAGRPGELERVCPQRFAAPLAAHLAAKAEGNEVDEELLFAGVDCWNFRSDVVLVEGAGGLFSPVSPRLLNADLVEGFGFPVVLVAANRLGVINDVLQAVIAAQAYRKGLPLRGLVLSSVSDRTPDPSVPTNGDEIAARIDVPLLACLPFGAEHFDRQVDWFELADVGLRG
jgi:dethiobiotin synthetase